VQDLRTEGELVSERATATVEALTAEVRVLMVGSRQVTLSVYGQLDEVPDTSITPMGRVAPKDAQPGWVYVVGKDNATGALARSSLPLNAQAARTWVASRSRVRYWQGQATEATRNATACENDADELDEAADKLTESNSSYVKISDKFFESVPYATGKAKSHKLAAIAARDAGAAAQTDIERLKASADEATARYDAEQSLANAAVAREAAERLRAAATELRKTAEAWGSRALEATGTAETDAENDSLECERIAEVSAEWDDLPLIVLAGLR
jgi:hypothetical protein